MCCSQNYSNGTKPVILARKHELLNYAKTRCKICFIEQLVVAKYENVMKLNPVH